ncbi:hypothetical protein NE237_007741 [Protea cynaroides]|uniref:Transcription and mRNA export factor ENY2 n=1 Tax=Protea cynaroides TaxID=273540 RepID=A0A9Q0KQ00_9MAGN|nr:hypothetical protein NE237_007741 [Protea cynaroides]
MSDQPGRAIRYVPAENELFDFPARRQVSEKKMRASINRPPTPDAEDQEKELTLQEIINVKLIESGEKERLKELLRERLIECGWRDEMKALCRAFTRKKGRNNVTVDDLIHVITPKGRASVPDSVKAELLQRIRTFLVSAAL